MNVVKDVTKNMKAAEDITKAVKAAAESKFLQKDSYIHMKEKMH